MNIIMRTEPEKLRRFYEEVKIRTQILYFWNSRAKATAENKFRKINIIHEHVTRQLLRILFYETFDVSVGYLVVSRMYENQHQIKCWTLIWWLTETNSSFPDV